MVFLSFSGADRLQGKSAQKCGPRPLVPRNRRNSSRVRSECAGARPLGPRGGGAAAAGRVDGARRARAQIPGGGKGLSICSIQICSICSRSVIFATRVWRIRSISKVCAADVSLLQHLCSEFTHLQCLCSGFAHMALCRATADLQRLCSFATPVQRICSACVALLCQACAVDLWRDL